MLRELLVDVELELLLVDYRDDGLVDDRDDSLDDDRDDGLGRLRWRLYISI